MMTSKRGLTSNSGKFKSIAEFFLNNKEKNAKELERDFSSEYAGRNFTKYYNQYSKVYFNDENHSDELDRTSACTAECWYESEFKEAVIDYLEKNNYSILDSNKYKCDGINLTLDIVAKRDKSREISLFEVKRCYHNHRLLTGIGQLFYHQFTKKEDNNFKYILVFPKSFKKMPDFGSDFQNYLKKQLKIEIWFI